MKNLKILYKLLIQWKWKFFASSLLLVVGMFFRSLEPLVIQVFVDSIIPSLKKAEVINLKKSNLITDTFIKILPDLASEHPFWFYLLMSGVLYFGISFLKGSVMFVAKSLNAFATEQAMKNLRDTIFRHIQKLPMSYFGESKIGDLTQRATGDIDTIRNFVATQIVDIIRLLSVFTFAFIMIYMQHKMFALISICLVPITAFASYYFFNKEQKIWLEHEEQSDKLNNATQENLSGIRVVKAFANEAFEIKKFEQRNQAKLKIALRHAKLHTIYWPLSDLIVNSQIFLSVLVGAWLTANGSLTIGQLIAFNTLVAMVAFPMRQVSRLLSQMGMALVAVGRIEEVLEAPEEDLSGAKIEKALKGIIEFRNVSFKYKDAEDYVLKNINFKINAGENIALIGPTGSGKSTLMKLLLRFYEPTVGEIFVDGIPLNTLSKESVRERIGIVLQKAFLFSDTIGNNISYTNSNKVNILETANISGLSNVANSFVNGFDTMVGEKGVSLSGGQKQRITLARTLLTEPDVLILDDVTSAVDTITEKEILNNLKTVKANRTTINITHRMSSLPFAHKIMIMEDGEITGFGTEQELEKTNKYFEDVLRIQRNISLN